MILASTPDSNSNKFGHTSRVTLYITDKGLTFISSLPSNELLHCEWAFLYGIHREIIDNLLFSCLLLHSLFFRCSPCIYNVFVPFVMRTARSKSLFHLIISPLFHLSCLLHFVSFSSVILSFLCVFSLSTLDFQWSGRLKEIDTKAI